MKQEIQNALQDALKATGVSIKTDSAVLATYTAERAAFLASLVGQPGYALAFEAERDNVVLKAGILATGQADSAQARIIGILTGVLGLAAQATAAGA